MGIVQQILLMLLLVGISAFFSLSEISIAASRKARLSVLADEGHPAAARVLALQAQRGPFFTRVQLGVSAVAIMGGIPARAS